MTRIRYVLISLLLLMACMFMLTGCHVIHKWQPADCEHPKTCIKCGETRGFPLCHDFIPVTCTEPKTCLRCGITQGWALGHHFAPANYQAAAGCVRCDIEDGDPLPADFETYGLTADMVCGRFYDVRQMCHDDTSATTTGKVIFSNYNVFENDEAHPAKDGYLWHTVDMTLLFDDDNMMKYGFSIGSTFEDYYNVTWLDNGALTDEDGVCRFAVNYNGLDYDECERYTESIPYLTYDDAECAVRGFRITYLIPYGYDGCVIGLRNQQIQWDDGQHIYDLDNTDSLFFRLDSDTKRSQVSENTLTFDEALKIVNSFYNGLSGDNYEEAADTFRLALEPYYEGNVIMSEDMTKAAAYDIISGKVKLPSEIAG
ncbi:MAG: hypothetical protein IJ608_06550 [Lachnospiraceae bacterium]|nr:hypothetical protein [Lachnospiraceae bacterium]